MAAQDLNVPSSLPPYSEIIYAAIDALNEKMGSNKTSISSYIESKYGNLPAGHSTLLRRHLNRMKESGELIFWKNNYMKPDPNFVRRDRGRPPKPKDGQSPADPSPEVYAPPPPPSSVAGATALAVPFKKKETRGRPMKYPGSGQGMGSGPRKRGMKFCTLAEMLPDLETLSPVEGGDVGPSGPVVTVADDDEDLIPVEQESGDDQGCQAKTPAPKGGSNKAAWAEVRCLLHSASNVADWACANLKGGWVEATGYASENARLREEVDLLRSCQSEKDKELKAVREGCDRILADKKKAVSCEKEALLREKIAYAEKDDALAKLSSLDDELKNLREQVIKAKQDAVDEYAAGYRQKARVNFFARAFYVLGGHVGIRQMAEHHEVPTIKFDPAQSYNLRPANRKGYVPPALGGAVGDREGTLEAWGVSALPDGEPLRVGPPSKKRDRPEDASMATPP